ncbi:MAG: hypothetical protein R3A44_31040 [Caldilineaceae bacterium]
MGTRSFIALQTNSGFSGVYCHWDGYLSHNGRILRDHYYETEKIKQLIGLGYMSTLGPTISTKHNPKHRTDDQTTYFHRDREHDWEECQPQRFETIHDLRKFAEDCGCEYLYLFDGHAWEYAERGAQFFGLSDGSHFSAFEPLPDNLDD